MRSENLGNSMSGNEFEMIVKNLLPQGYQMETSKDYKIKLTCEVDSARQFLGLACENAETVFLKIAIVTG